MSLLSKVTYPSDGVTRIYSIPFPYIDRAYVNVALSAGGPPSFSFLSDTQIQLDEAAAAGVAITIYRETPVENPVVFQDGSLLSAADLNASSARLLHIEQEQIDKAADVTPPLQLDSGGTGKKCRVEALWVGTDDNGNDIWSLVATTVI